jgi:hypothetical protein
MQLAKWVFLVAGVYGLLVLLPQFFFEERVGRDYPPPITHPEFFYGFFGVAAAWQVAFLIIARDPVRYRPLMIPSVLEKLAFGVATAILFLGERVSAAVLAFGLIDLALAVLFLVAFARTPPGK